MIVITWITSQKLLRNTGGSGCMLGSSMPGQLSARTRATVETAAAATAMYFLRKINSKIIPKMDTPKPTKTTDSYMLVIGARPMIVIRIKKPAIMAAMPAA